MSCVAPNLQVRRISPDLKVRCYTMCSKRLKIRQLHRSLRIDLAQCRETPYLCGMKRLILRIGLRVSVFCILFQLSEAVIAQTDGITFYPSVEFFTHDSIGSTLTFSLGVGASGVFNGVEISGTSGVVPNPNYLNTNRSGNGGTQILVSVKLDRAGCFMGILSANGGSFTANCNITGYVYDPRTIGRVYLDSNTLNFGGIAIGSEDSIFENVLYDTISNISVSLQPLNLRPPFASQDSIVSQYTNCGYLSSGLNYGWYFHFLPTKIGHYVDTTYLYDLTRKDSTMLILIGDGVAAGVAESVPDEPAMQVYPNPCDQFANIVVPLEGLEQVEIRNALGAVVQSYRNVNSDLTMDVSSLPGGIYFIEARSEGAIITKKLVVIH
jgi:hypothetical protein